MLRAAATVALLGKTVQIIIARDDHTNAMRAAV
jgi:hypothetical protein